MPDLYERAAIIPGRSMTRSKAPDRLRRAWAASAQGAIILDTEGREYIDLVCGLGAISLGYQWRHAPGGVYSLPHACEVQAAEAVLQHVAPWASHVRFTKTGSEATHAAYRIAKKLTGRNLVAMGDWAYHGWHEWCDDKMFPFTARYRHGHRFGDEPLRLPFMPSDAPAGPGDIDGEELAAVIIEPHRWEPIDTGWLKSVRAFCDHAGALLIFDSMIYGGRWALGGATEYFGVQPDLECFGKAFGGGEAVAFVVGREALAEHGELVSGTYSGDVTGLAAVIDTLDVYRTEPVIETLWARGKQLGRGLKAVIPESIATIDGAAPLQRIRFVDPAHREQFKDAMHARGILTYPDWFMTCYAHTPAHIEHVIAMAEASIATLTTEDIFV